MAEYTRITMNPEQCGGMPCIRGLRIPVAAVVAMLADGLTEAEVLRDLPDLEPEDIREAVGKAKFALASRDSQRPRRNPGSPS